MRLAIIESPYDCGARDRRMGAGPGHLLRSGLQEHLAAAGHEVSHQALDLGPDLHPEVGSAVELARRIAGATSRAVAQGALPVVLSGNCNAAIGAVAGIGARRTGVLWFDAHGDLNTPETSASGFFDGMCYAMLLGHGWRSLAATIPGFEPVAAERAALAAARDLDPPEIDHIAAWGLATFPVAKLRAAAAPAALAAFAARSERLYVHVDLDALDPEVLIANHLAVTGGVLVEELCAAIAAAAQGAPIAGIGFASYAPESDDRNAGPGAVRAIFDTAVGA